MKYRQPVEPKTSESTLKWAVSGILGGIFELFSIAGGFLSSLLSASETFRIVFFADIVAVVIYGMPHFVQGQLIPDTELAVLLLVTTVLGLAFKLCLLCLRPPRQDECEGIPNTALMTFSRK